MQLAPHRTDQAWSPGHKQRKSVLSLAKSPNMQVTVLHLGRHLHEGNILSEVYGSGSNQTAGFRTTLGVASDMPSHVRSLSVFHKTPVYPDDIPSLHLWEKGKRPDSEVEYRSGLWPIKQLDFKNALRIVSDPANYITYDFSTSSRNLVEIDCLDVFILDWVCIKLCFCSEMKVRSKDLIPQ